MNKAHYLTHAAHYLTYRSPLPNIPQPITYKPANIYCNFNFRWFFVISQYTSFLIKKSLKKGHCKKILWQNVIKKYYKKQSYSVGAKLLLATQGAGKEYSVVEYTKQTHNFYSIRTVWGKFFKYCDWAGPMDMVLALFGFGLSYSDKL